LEVLGHLETYLPPGWKEAASPEVDHLYSLRVGGRDDRTGIRRYHVLYRGILRLARTMDLAGLLEAFDSDLHLLVAERARRRVFVHAGVVSWQGRAIVIPGRSRSGKTSLVAALVRAGATYYSDEYAVFDAQGRVHPYPKPLSIRRADAARPQRCPVEALGGFPGAKALPVGLVAVSQYRPGARWRPRPLSRGLAALALLANTVPARRRPEAALDVLEQVASRAHALKGARGEAEETVGRILSTLGAC
jgi:hypothetical protein